MKKVTTPAIPSLMREINERSVLDILRTEGTLHAAQVARLIGLSKPTTADILRTLSDHGLIHEYLPGDDDPKRARSVYEAISDVKVCLGIDIGSRFIRTAVGDLNGEIRSQQSIAVKSLTLKDLVSAMHSSVEESLKSAGFSLKDVVSIVVGTPGVVNQETGVISIAGTISSLDGVNLSALIEKEFGVKPNLENDINLVTVAEQSAGKGAGIDNFAVLSVGSGLGSGLVLNGKLLRGHHGAAGEVFYVPFGDPTDTHRTATNPSGDAVAALARALAKKHKKSTLAEPYSSVDILNAAKSGDSLAKEVVAIEAERIALYIASISAITDVELVVLTGGIGRQAEFFMKSIKELVTKAVPFPPRIEISTLGDTGILVGALSIATKIACDLVFERKNFVPPRSRAGSL